MQEELEKKSLKRSSVSFLETLYNSLAGQAPAYSIAGGAALIIGSSFGASPLAMLITLLGIMPVVFAIYTLSRKYVNAASFYDYVKRNIGETAGFINGIVYTLFYSILGIGSEAIAFGYLGYESIYAVTGTQFNPLFFVAFPVILAFVVAYLGIKPSVRSEVVLTSIEIITLLAFSFLSLASHLSELTLYPFTLKATFQNTPSAIFSALSAGLIFGVTYFMGFEVSTMVSEEAKDPTRSVPWATMLATLFMGFLYIIVIYSVLIDIGINPNSINVFISMAEGSGPNPVYTLIKTYLGYPGEVLFAVSVLISVFGSYLATLNATARMLFGMSRDRMLPSFLSSVNSKFKSPDRALIISTVLAALSALLSYAVAFIEGYTGIGLTYNAMEIAYAADTLFYVFSLLLIAISAIKVTGAGGRIIIVIGMVLLSLTFYFSITYITYMYVFLASLVVTALMYIIVKRLSKK
ncbi:MAG: APC family permease [Nitrososphaeria archaeon]|nr:APC family permease [Conexivisphaerales archaeon]